MAEHRSIKQGIAGKRNRRIEPKILPKNILCSRDFCVAFVTGDIYILEQKMNTPGIKENTAPESLPSVKIHTLYLQSILSCIESIATYKKGTLLVIHIVVRAYLTITLAPIEQDKCPIVLVLLSNVRAYNILGKRATWKDLTGRLLPTLHCIVVRNLLVEGSSPTARSVHKKAH